MLLFILFAELLGFRQTLFSRHFPKKNYNFEKFNIIKFNWCFQQSFAKFILGIFFLHFINIIIIRVINRPQNIICSMQ